MTIPLQKMQVGAIQIEYQISDYTDPWRDEPETILFHHGYCRNMDFWRGWVPSLARDYRVLRFNSRGCGGTTAPPPGTPYDAGQLVGENSPLAKKEQMEQMQARMPNAKLVVFEGYGHGINLLIPERCVAEVRSFLGKPAAT